MARETNGTPSRGTKRARAKGELPWRRARAWLVEAALPYWSRKGIDPKHGGFIEAAALDGTPLLQRDKRVRVQARQIYVMSHAALLGFGEKHLQAARAGFEFLTRCAWHPEGGFVHLLAPDGSVKDARRDTYDHAFVLLALSWYLRASDDSRVEAWIERTLEAIERHLWEPATASFREAVPEALPRRQNPHMHMLEAMVALDEATGDPRARGFVERMLTLFETRFFNKESGTLTEYFDESWHPLSGAEGQRCEPGHHCEWLWLLKICERRYGGALRHWREALYAFVDKFGRAPASGLLYDEVAPDGRVLKPTMRCWPQTEALKASLVRHEEGDAAARAEVLRACEALFSRYLALAPSGLWQDQFDASGRALARDVPASTLYHLFLGFAELLRVAGAAEVPSGAQR
jgi:mannose/cellobiose epimerase-like protein (N-acyl-D-glucosamine 2-epimerase family)